MSRMLGMKYRWGNAAFLFGALFIAVPLVISPNNVIEPGSAEGDFALGVVQLIALVMPALAIFTQALLQISYQRAERRGKSGGLGPFGPEILRGTLVSFAGLSSLLMLLGLASLLTTIRLPPELTISVGLILIGIGFLPFIVVGVGLLMLLESKP